MRAIANPTIIFVSSILCTLGCLYFGYIFLIDDEILDNKTKNHNGEWIKEMLTSTIPEDGKHLYSNHYGQWFVIDKHCQKSFNQTRSNFDKLVFIVIDALRVDFVQSILTGVYKDLDGASPQMKFMETKLESNGIGLLSLATIPTVTLPRVKALLSGKLPSFIDYILNLSSFTFEDDNFVKQLSYNNKNIVFYGDDTWNRLFVSSNRTFVRSNFTSSLFATDYTFVDLNVTWNVQRELENLSSWDVMILHYLGVDHIGHLKGFNSPLFYDKFKEMDNVFRNIFEAIHSKPSNVSFVQTFFYIFNSKFCFFFPGKLSFCYNW